MKDGLDILDNDAMEDLIIERADSNKWFVLPGFSEKASLFISALENKFYMNGNNANFEICMGDFRGLGFGAFAFALKEDISLEAFKKFKDTTCPNSRHVPIDMDAIFIISDMGNMEDNDDLENPLLVFIDRLSKKGIK